MGNRVYQQYHTKQFKQSDNIGSAIAITDLLDSGLDGDEIAVLLQAKTKGVVFRTDGGAPTTAIGFLLEAGDSAWIDTDDLSKIKVIAAESTAVVVIEVYSAGQRVV